MLITMILYGSAIFATAFLGGVAPLFIPRLNDDRLKICLSVGAGLLLGMAFLHMLPEAAHFVPESFGTWFLVGFVVLLVLERFIMVHACDEHGCHYHTVGLAAFAGLTVHGLIEGFALASTLFVSQLGPLVLLAILAHKVPAGFALTTILKLGKKTKRQIVGFNAGVALSGPVGLLLAYTILENQKLPGTAGILLAASAGTFVYIAACDLLPELHKTTDGKFKRLAGFFAGLLLSFLSESMLGH